MRIYRSFAAGAYPRPCIAEMGGKNPAIVSRHANLEDAATGILRSAFGLQGQKCSANSRIIVEAPVKDKLTQMLADRTAKLTIGDPTQRENWLGPVVNASSYREFSEFSEELSQAGQMVAVTADQLNAYLTGVLSAQGASVAILNGVPVVSVSGATFFVGYGSSGASMINGGSQENTDPGFEAIKKLKPSVVMMYSQADQVVPLFEREEIAIAVWYPDRVGAAAAKGLSVATAFPKEGAIGILPTVSVPEGAKNKALAQKYIDQVLSAETQKCFAEKQYGGPVNKTVTLDDKLAAQLPYGAAVDRMHFPDPETTAKLLPSWSERWGREIAR